MGIFKSSSPTQASVNTKVIGKPTKAGHSTGETFKPVLPPSVGMAHHKNTSILYSLDPKEVKKVLDAVLTEKPFDQNQFLFYHLYRNHFNVKNEVTTLRKIEEGKYIDNLDNIWDELSAFKNFFHMPKGNWAGSVLGVTTPYSRKFVRDDYVSGVGGEFEMIIKSDGKRIDALVEPNYQETYNYGRTRNTSAHKTLDIYPHNSNSNYLFRRDMGSVKITD